MPTIVLRGISHIVAHQSVRVFPYSSVNLDALSASAIWCHWEIKEVMQVEVRTTHLPRITKWHVRKSLRWFNPADLAGIKSIRLLGGRSDEEIEEPVYLKGVFSPAEYEQHKQASYIYLYTESLYTSIPSLLKYTPMATLRVAFVLAHEVGHHLIAKRGYVFDLTEKYKHHGKRDTRQELAADKFASAVINRMMKSHFYRFGWLLSKLFSNICYEIGVSAYSRSDYDRAAYYWFHAFTANPMNSEAARAYQKAMTQLNGSVANIDLM